MRFKHFFSFLGLFLILCALPCTAKAGPSYQNVQTEHPSYTSWDRGLTMSFVLDEAKCKKSYGARWAQECASPAMGAVGSRAAGIKMTPQTPGEWRWISPSSIRFTPSTASGALKPGTKYNVDISGLALPDRVQLSSQKFSYTTQPQAVSAGTQKIWIDPSAEARHGISIPLTFIWPVNPEAVEKQISLAPAYESGLRLGEPRFAWSMDKTSCILSVRILNLPEGNSRAALFLGGLPTFYTHKDGYREITRVSADTHAVSFDVQGKNDLFTVEKMELAKGHDSSLNRQIELTVKTSLRVDPKKLLSKLHLYELPEKLAPGATAPTDWTRMPGIDEKDLAESKVLTPVLLSSADPSDTIRFAVPLQNDRCLLAYALEGLTSVSGLTTNKTKALVLKCPSADAELSFLQPGNILNLSGSGRIALHAIGIDSLNWKIRSIQTPFLAMFAANHGFSTDTLEDWEPEGTIDLQSKSTSGTMPVACKDANTASFPILSMPELLKGLNKTSGLIKLELKGMKNGKQAVSASKIILVTNIGLTIKEEADGCRLAFVQDLATGQPVKGAQVQLLARNGQTLHTAAADDQGCAHLAAANGYEGENEPVAVTASKSDNPQSFAWISLKDRSRSLDYGSFAVEGRHSAGAGLSASVFSERGMYMPGETLHFGIMVRRFDWQPLAASLPLEAVITDPTGRVVHKAPLTGNPALAEASWKSPETCATGPYQFDVRVKDKNDNGPVLGTCQVRVEEFEPDTLALAAALTPDAGKGWIKTSGSVQAALSLRTLYGEPARQHSLRSKFLINPAKLSFPEFAGYTFFDPSLATDAREISLPLLSTDNDGKASLPLPTDAVQGTFRGILRVEGFEAAGGRAVTRQINALFSPLSFVVGYRTTEQANTLESLQPNTPCSLSIVAVDNTLKPIKLEGVTCTVSERTYVNTLVRDNTGAFRYEATPLDKPLTTNQFSVQPDGSKITLDTKTPGDYLLTLKGTSGEVLLSVPYTVAGRTLQLADSAASSSFSLQDCNLQLKLDKENYEPGQTITLQLNAPYDGTGLVTIEREKVVASTWFSCKAGESVQKITIPASFEGQGYVNVLFMRAASSDAVYLKPHVYAAQPFTSGYQKRNMQVTIKTPESVLPGSDLEVQVSAKRSGKVLLFAVDEGILSLTSFATPNPLKDLLSNRALDVVTKQALDLLMPDTKQLAGRISAFGGDMGLGGGRFLNPFKRRSEPPFARWLGLVDVSETPVSIRIPVPSYLSGRIRVMAVGSSEKELLTAGSAAAGVKVRGSLLLRPLLPLAALPGDTFSGAITIANTIAGSGKNVPVVVTIKPDKATLEATSGQSTEYTVNVDENAEATIPFTLRCKDELGSASVTFTARLASDKDGKSLSTREQSLSIRPAGTLLTTEQQGYITAKTMVDVPRDIYKESAETLLTVSAAPVAAYRSLAAKLRDYPFGCTEQQISKAFPVIAAGKRPELEKLLLADANLSADKRRERDEQTLSSALAQLSSSLTWEGASLWAGGEADPFVTIYAADFLVTMIENGRTVPQDLLQNVKNCLSNFACRETTNLQDARLKAYACWVLTRSGSIVTQDVERIHSWLASRGTYWTSDIAATLLADCYAMLREEKTAVRLMPQTLAYSDFVTGDYFSPDAACALHCYIRSLPRWQGKVDGSMDMSDALERAFRPTASTTAMALTSRALLGGMPEPGQDNGGREADIKCLEYAKDSGGSSLTVSRNAKGMDMLSAPSCRRFAVSAPSASSNMLWHLRVTGYDRGPAQSHANGMEVKRRYLNTQGVEVQEVKEGDILTVEISVRSDQPLNNVAVVDLLPGCFEPMLTQEGITRPQQVTHNERREDRWLFFTSTDTSPVLLTYRVRALIAGSFQVPAVTAESMYEPSVNASQSGGRITVTPR